MPRDRTLKSAHIVTDRTVENLLNHGWLPYDPGDPYFSTWMDPRSGQHYCISQAEAIRQDRLTPRYKFVW